MADKGVELQQILDVELFDGVLINTITISNKVKRTKAFFL